MRVLRDMALGHLYSAPCASLHETSQLLPRTEQVALRNVTPLHEITRRATGHSLFFSV